MVLLLKLTHMADSYTTSYQIVLMNFCKMFFFPSPPMLHVGMYVQRDYLCMFTVVYLPCISHKHTLS